MAELNQAKDRFAAMLLDDAGDFVVKAKVIGAIYRYVGHRGRMNPVQRRQSRERRTPRVTVKEAAAIGKVGWERFIFILASAASVD